MEINEKEKDVRKARKIVFRLLKFRLRSEGEVREKLAAGNIPAPLIEPTIERFKDLKLIDDHQFAKEWIASRLKRPLGINRIRQELRKKGIEKTMIEASLKAAVNSYDEEAVVTELAQHRMTKYKDIDPQKSKQRVYGYLQRRGFNTNTIIQVIQKL